MGDEAVRKRCKLCRRIDELRRSHIVSNFALRDTRGKDRTALLRVSSEEATRLPRDQLWDVECLLCGDCEHRRCEWEAIIAATLTDRAPGHTHRPELRVDTEYPDHMIHADGICYGPVKFWVLSTLHLMHHATKIDWIDFSLTVDEEHGFRSRILSGDAGSDLEFQIFGRITVRSSRPQDVGGGVIAPGRISEFCDDRTRTRMGHFSAVDCEWTVLLGDWPDNPLRDARLHTDGTWRPLRDTDFEAMIRAAQGLNLVS